MPRGKLHAAVSWPGASRNMSWNGGRSSLISLDRARSNGSATGKSPAQLVETVRLDAARALLSQNLPLKRIVAKVGLYPTRPSAAFERRFGMALRLFRAMHRQNQMPRNSTPTTSMR